jgi:hypothetical protein
MPWTRLLIESFLVGSHGSVLGGQAKRERRLGFVRNWIGKMLKKSPNSEIQIILLHETARIPTMSSDLGGYGD